MKIRNITLSILLVSLCGCIATNKTKSEFNVKNISIDADTYPAVVLGGGVGGLTAAVYLAQAGLEPVVIQGDTPGGLITQSSGVENWPGEIKISGSDLANKIKRQALKCGAQIINKKISAVDFSSWPYKITICDIADESQTKEIKALSCLVAMGSKPNLLNVVGESGPQGYFGKGVSTCAICDGSLYKNKTVAVVGGGNSAMTEALYLSSLAKKIYILVRSDKLRASHHEHELVLQKQNIEIIFNRKVVQILGDGNKVTSIILEDTKADANGTDSVKELVIDGLFLAIGSTPNTQIFKGQLELDPLGFIKKFDAQETSVPGIFTAGDISDNRFKQAITASGDAAKAALQMINFLQTAGYVHAKKETTQTDSQAKAEIKKIIEIKNQKHFNEIVASAGDKTVVADFYGTFCIPCKNMAPIFEKLAQNYGEQVIFVKINISENLALAKQFEIQSVPTFLFIEDEEVSQKIVGTRSYEFLEKVLKE